MFAAGFVRAMTVAQGRRGARSQRRRLIGESGTGNYSQQDGNTNRLPDSARRRVHELILGLGAEKTDSTRGGKLLVFKSRTY